MDGSQLVFKIKELLEREGQFPNDNNIVSKLNTLDSLQLWNILNGLEP